MRILQIAVAAFAAGLEVFAQPVGLDEILAPVVVGVQPTCACNDLCVLDDGEIRHYGRQMQNGKVVSVYVASRDNGLSWKTFRADDRDVGAMVKSPYSGEWISFGAGANGAFACLRSKKGPGDVAPERIALPWKKVYVRQLLPLKSRRRWIATIVDVACANGECYHAAVGLSDDDGRTWKYVKVPPVRGVERLAPGDKRPHWFCNGTEPSVAELSDGTLLLVVRTSGPHAAFYRSTDGGETWSEGRPDPRFWQANTMPLLFRMKGGRLLFFWNNTQMLPTRDAAETPELGPTEADGTWEAVFTNRDALHAAYSDDDGRTWKGFREVALCEIRNRPDFRELGNNPAQELDKSVHQTQAVELPGGKVLLAYGQNSAARRMMIFDPKWLEETKRKDDFREGLENLSTHLYLKSHSGGARGWAGHCCWNRLPGAALIRNPDLPLTNRGEVLQLARIRDPRLVCDRQGIVWNFPASRKGRVGVNARVPGEGFRFTLADHWINPCDETNPALSPVSVPFTAKELPCAKPVQKLKDWHDVTAEWDCERGTVVFSVDGKVVRTEKMAWVPAAGLSYLHLQALAEGEDPAGAQFRVFWAEGARPAADDSARLQALLDKGGEVRFPAGEFTVEKTLVVRPGTHLVCEKGFKARLADGANCAILANRDVKTNLVADISVEGGLWDGNNVHQDRSKYSEAGFTPPLRYGARKYGQLIVFSGVRNLRLGGMTVKDPQGFSIMLTDVEDFSVTNVTFDCNDRTPNEDGVHVNGFARRGVIRGIRGHTNDDLVALNSDEGDFRTGDCTIEDILIEDLDGGARGYTGVRLLSRHARVRDVTIRNVRGKFQFNVVSFTHWAGDGYRPGMGHFDGIVIEDVTATSFRKEGVGHGGLIWFQDGVQDVGTVAIRRLRREEGAEYRNRIHTIDIGEDVGIRELRLEDVSQRLADDRPLVRRAPSSKVLSFVKKENQGRRGK